MIEKNIFVQIFERKMSGMDEIELTIRLIMNHKEACQVIGRDASNIKTLRNETGSKIVLSSREYKNRILSITDQKKQVMKGKL